MCEQLGIDQKTRFLVLFLDAGLNAAQIAKILDRSVRTVEKWVIKTRKGKDIRILKKGRKPKKPRAPPGNEIEIPRLQHLEKEASTIKFTSQIKISANAIAKTVSKAEEKENAGIENIVTFSKDTRTQRVNFCKKMLFEEGLLIYRTFFSNELEIDFTKTHKTESWPFPADKIKKESATESVKLTCWGAVSAHGATSLEIYEKSLNGELYKQLIKRHKGEMERLYPSGEFYLLQDDRPAYRAIEEWLNQHQRPELIKLPRRSPDLNIIENLWTALKMRIKIEAPINEKELLASLVKNWKILTEPDRLQLFFQELQRRCMDCIAKDGQKLLY